jgi:hypothetical protein
MAEKSTKTENVGKKESGKKFWQDRKLVVVAQADTDTVGETA